MNHRALALIQTSSVVPDENPTSEMPTNKRM